MGREKRRMSAMEEMPNGPVVQKKKFVPKALSQDEATIKDIKIKMGICKRCTKELGLYKDENTKLQAVVDKLVADGACDHDVKKQKEVLEENVNIIPSAISRLQDAYENLWSLCEEHSGTAAVTESPVWARLRRSSRPPRLLRRL